MLRYKLKYLGAKEIIKDCILDTMQDEMIAALRKTQPLGILFFGAPGTGDFEKSYTYIIYNILITQPGIKLYL